jgi:hypothetical protein
MRVLCKQVVVSRVRWSRSGTPVLIKQARAGHLRIDIQDSNRNYLGVEYAGLL